MGETERVFCDIVVLASHLELSEQSQQVLITSAIISQSSSASYSLLHIIPLLVARCTDQGTRNEAVHRIIQYASARWYKRSASTLEQTRREAVARRAWHSSPKPHCAWRT